MSRTIANIIGLVLCVAAISHCTMQGDLEEAKQRAFMMKACVDAGGDWSASGWRSDRSCVRPKAEAR